MLLTGAVGLTASLRTVTACTDEHPASLALSLDEPLIPQVGQRQSETLVVDLKELAQLTVGSGTFLVSKNIEDLFPDRGGRRSGPDRLLDHPQMSLCPVFARVEFQVDRIG